MLSHSISTNVRTSVSVGKVRRASSGLSYAYPKISSSKRTSAIRLEAANKALTVLEHYRWKMRPCRIRCEFRCHAPISDNQRPGFQNERHFCSHSAKKFRDKRTNVRWFGRAVRFCRGGLFRGFRRRRRRVIRQRVSRPWRGRL